MLDGDVTVYRLQLPDGRGVYASQNTVNGDDAVDGESAAEFEKRLNVCLATLGFTPEPDGHMHAPMMVQVLAGPRIEAFRKQYKGQERRPAMQDEYETEPGWFSEVAWGPDNVQFAFASIEQLKHWFDPKLDRDDWAAMEKAGACVVKLTLAAEHVKTTPHQAVYHPLQVKHSEVLSIKEVLLGQTEGKQEQGEGIEHRAANGAESAEEKIARNRHVGRRRRPGHGDGSKDTESSKRHL